MEPINFRQKMAKAIAKFFEKTSRKHNMFVYDYATDVKDITVTKQYIPGDKVKVRVEGKVVLEYTRDMLYMNEDDVKLRDNFNKTKHE